jgi:3-amino-4-hydroxybenzoic acid synthase
MLIESSPETRTQVQMKKRESFSGPILWMDARKSPELVTRALQSGYNGLLLDLKSLSRFEPELTSRVTCLVEADVFDEAALETCRRVGAVLASSSTKILEDLKSSGLPTAYLAHVDDADSLHDAIHLGKRHSYVVMSFQDPTNIPLELVIASLQPTNTVLVKQIAPNDIDDAIVTLGVMEVGADGILFTPEDHASLDIFLKKFSEAKTGSLPLEVGEILSSRPVGMGYRSCIDLATLFSEEEGMLVGSTSQGGVLCCPEVFYLPYMELRPFRVNAGAVHSYVYNLENKTDYMTELRAGSPVMVVNLNGKVRQAFVGRMKTEMRPLRLIEVGFSEGRRVNILLQDDWHVRIFSDEGKPRNITELKPGDRVLGYVAEPGRHVGIKVSEHIIEN